jgi:hypothetical protein
MQIHPFMDHNYFCFKQIYFLFLSLSLVFAFTKKTCNYIMHSGVSWGHLAYFRYRMHGTEYAGKIKECRVDKDLERGSHVITYLMVLFLEGLMKIDTIPEQDGNNKAKV